MAEYRLTPAALRDLEDIWLYTQGQWGSAQADRYVDALVEALAELAKSPRMAPACDHIRSGYRRRGIERHMIYPRFADFGVVIVRILHDRMDAPRHLE